MKSNRGFSLVELLVSMTIFITIMLLMSQMLSSTLGIWRRSSDTQVQFQEARAAFNSISMRLASAELNPYWGYEYGNGASQSPTSYAKRSDLHFVCGGASEGNRSTPALLDESNHPTQAIFFHGAFGASNEIDNRGFGSLLNSWGYFIEFGSDVDNMADFLTTEGNVEPRYRFRMMEMQMPSERLTTFANISGDEDQLDLEEAESSADVFSWFRSGAADYATPLAENIVALIITPLPANQGGSTTSQPEDLAPNYYYDTRAAQHSSGVSNEVIAKTAHQLPPLVRITLVAITEKSALDLEQENDEAMPDLGIDELFDDVTEYEEDMAALEKALVAKGIDFRIFNTTVKLRNSRWNETE